MLAGRDEETAFASRTKKQDRERHIGKAADFRLYRLRCRSVLSFVAGDTWPRQQEEQLRLWVEANLVALLAYWDSDIIYDQDLRAKLVTV